MDNIMSPSENGMSKTSLENIMAFASYIPLCFGLFFVATLKQNDDYEDKSGTSGTMAAIMCIAYAMCAGAASGGGSTDLCKALVLARIVLGVMATIASVLILALGDETDKVLRFVLMYLLLALLTVPEAGIMYLYVRQVQLEKFMAQGGNLQAAAMQPGPANFMGPPPLPVQSGMPPGPYTGSVPYPGAAPYPSAAPYAGSPGLYPGGYSG
mmetsp:Transcript_26039/g.60310  ORF Transcript_26039/g.60310 Transcript_26039/m.60310 type:complete len:211 (-) Transcript_26039:98-730(-)